MDGQASTQESTQLGLEASVVGRFNKAILTEGVFAIAGLPRSHCRRHARMHQKVNCEY